MNSRIQRATRQLHRKRSMISFGAAALLAVAATAQVTTIDDSGKYRQEVQACNSGQTQEDRATCLREARNAQAEKQRGRLSDGNDYAANTTARCEVFRAAEDRRACLARLGGEGTVTGSVAGGGLLREYSYQVPGDASAAMAPAARDNPSAPQLGTSSVPSSTSTMGAPAADAPATGPSRDPRGSDATPLVPAAPLLMIVPVVPR